MSDTDLFTAAREPALGDLDALCHALRGRDVDARVRLAARAGTLGQAFAAGYLAATLALTNGPSTELVSLSFTEPRGGGPGGMKTRCVRGVGDAGATLRGEKVWATLAPRADRVLVIAGEGEPTGIAPEPLVATLLGRDRAGLSIEPMPNTPFCPDVPHARLTLDAVDVPSAEVLADAYGRFVKPFRPLEDQLVGAALAHYLTVLAIRHDCTADTIARGVSLTQRSPELGPASALAELGAYGYVAEVGRFAEGLTMELEGEALAELQRDRGLFSVALPIRIARRDKALRSLRGS
jgi:acyl-CoA dehydrogenase